MELRLICGTKNFKISESIEDFRLDIFSLSNQVSTLSRLIGTPDFMQSAGMIEIKALNDNPHFTASADIHHFLDTKVDNPTRLSENKAEFLQTFMMCLWFVKDCCSNIYKLYVYTPADRYVFYRMRTVFFSSSRGEYNATVFSKTELDHALLIFNKLLPLMEIDIEKEEELSKKKKEKIGEITPGDFNYFNYNTQTRIQRAIIFLSLARGSSFLPLKISSYIEIFETLFTTDNSEVSHKVSERLAFYIGGSGDDKYQNFKIMKTAYGIRSKFVHGQKLDKSIKSIDDLIAISTRMDQIARLLLTKIIVEDSLVFLQDDNTLNQYLSNMIFDKK